LIGKFRNLRPCAYTSGGSSMGFLGMRSILEEGLGDLSDPMIPVDALFQ
jgi:hypothetical protein